MKTILIVFLFALLFASLCFPQSYDVSGAGVKMFANDTLTLSEVLTSNPLYTGFGYSDISIEMSITLLGDSADAITVYYKMFGGVPFDSIGVDSIEAFVIDSTYVADGDPFVFDLSGQAWYVDHTDGLLILAAPATLDSVKVNCQAKGYRK